MRVSVHLRCRRCVPITCTRHRWHKRLISILLVFTVLVVQLPAAGPARTAARAARAAQSEETVRILGMPGARLRRQSSTQFTLIEHHDVGQSADNAELPYELEVSVLRDQLRGGAAKNGTARPPVSGLPLPGRKAAFTASFKEVAPFAARARLQLAFDSSSTRTHSV